MLFETKIVQTHLKFLKFLNQMSSCRLILKNLILNFCSHPKIVKLVDEMKSNKKLKMI